MTSGMWGCAAHGAISGMKWAGANLLEFVGNLDRFALMSRRTHALIVIAGEHLQTERACARPHERRLLTKENIDGKEKDQREKEDH